MEEYGYGYNNGVIMPEPYGLGLPLRPEPPKSPKSQADCPKGTKFRIETEYGYGTDGDVLPREVGYCGEPESQADCGEGMTFYTEKKRKGCPPNARCIQTQEYRYSKCIPNDQCEREWEAMKQSCAKTGSVFAVLDLKNTLPCKDLELKKEEFIKSCKAKYGIKETPVEVVTTALKPTTEEGEYKTWIIATMIGVGLYLILANKSE